MLRLSPHIRGLLGLSLLFPTSQLFAQVPYFTDFESGIGSEWSAAAVDSTEPGAFTQFSGRFSDDAQTLTLSNLVAGQSYTVGFDLYVIDSWDGPGDYFNVSVGGAQIFHETFSNYNGEPPSNPQTYPETPDEGRAYLGFSGSFVDAIYRNIELGFAASNSTVQITFAGSGLQGVSDESWGIDNVGVRLTASLSATVIRNSNLPTAGATNATVVDAFNVVGSRKLEVASATNAANYELREAGLNGALGDGDDSIYTLMPVSSGTKTVAFTFNNEPLQPGFYRFRTLSGLHDINGAPMTPYTNDFAVINPAGGRIENTSNGTISTATPLPMTESPVDGGLFTALGIGSFSAAGDVDYWRFEAEAGDHLTVRLETDATGTYPQLRLQNSSGQNLRSAGGNNAGAVEFQDYAFSTPGTYYLQVYNDYRAAHYRMRVDQARQVQLEVEGNDSQAAANNLVLSLATGAYQGQVAGTATAPGDYFRLGTLNVGNAISVTLQTPAASSLQTTNSTITLEVEGNGTAVATNQSGTLNYTVAADGVYYVRIESTSTDGLLAQYRLGVVVTDGVAPLITGDTLPAEGSTSLEVIDRLTLSFSEDLKADTLTNAASWDLRSAGIDGLFGTADDVVYSLANSGYASGLSATFQIPDGPLQPGQLRFTARTNLTDRADNHLAAAYIRQFTIGSVSGFPLENRDNDAPWGATSLSLSGSGQADGSFVSLGSTGVGGHPYWVAAGLFNGDTNLDLAVANNNDGTVSVLLGAGDGSFVLSTNYATGAGPVMVGVVDLNSGGALDLVVANYDSGTISVLLGNGDGTFGVSSNYVVGSRPREIGAGDLNGDGKADLVVANENSDNLSVLVGNGDGTLQGAVNYAAGDGPWSVSLGDVNGDGKLDVAAANQNSDNLSVWLGNGDGTLQGAVNYPAGDGNRSVRLGDLDGNGSLDAVLVSANDNRVNVLLGGGDGTFGGVWSVGTGASNPYGSILEDLDEDGRLDVAVANLNSDRVSVLLGKGDGTFGGAVNYGTGNGSISVAAGDYDGDGRKDLAVANYYGNTVGVLLGNGEKLLVEDPTGSGVRTGSGRGNVASTSDVDYWSFTGEAGDGLVAAVEVPGSPAASSLSIQTYGPDGSRIDSYGSDYYGWGQSGPLSLPVSGTYNVRVSYNNQYFGEYRLRVTLARAPLQLESENNNSIGQADAPSLVLTNGHQVATLLGYLSAGDNNGDYYYLGNLAEGTTVILGSRQPSSSAAAFVLGVDDGSGAAVAVGLAGDTNLTFAIPAGQDGPYYARVTSGSAGYGVRNYALRFDGSGNYVAAGAWSPGTNWTLEAWVNPSSLPSGRRSVVGGFNSCLDWGVGLNGGQWAAGIKPPGTCSGPVVSAQPVAVNEWYHIAGTCDGSIANLYVNGTLEASGAVEANYSGTTSGTRIGGEYCCGGNNFPGLIDEVRIWNRALSANEIATNMTRQLTGTEPGLVAYWNFNEGLGSAAADLTGNGHDGTISGATWVGLGSTNAGSPGLLAQYLLDIDLADTLPPVITSDTLPAEGSTNAIVVDRFMLGFSEDMTAGTVTDSGNYELREAGLDGVLDTADDRFYDVVSTGYSSGLTGDYRVGDGPLQAGLYRFKALTGLADRAGNRMAVAYVRSFRVVDVPGYLLENRDNDAPWGATSLSLSGSGQADGSFVSLGSTGVGGHPYWVAAGLFNGDTNLDLAVANNNDGTVSVLLGAGDGSFVLSTNYATGAGPVMVGVVNLNSGGALDLVVANYDSGTISVLLGNGDGTFGVSSNYVVGSRPREIGAGDLNGDGKADLVVANENSDNLSVLVGNGDGTLQGAVNYAAGDGPWSVSLGDVNGDGKLDVAAANQNSDNLSVWLGNGDGTLQGAVNYPAGDGNRSVRLGDLDGNGSLDAVLVSANDNRVNVLLGGGDGTFGGVWSVGTGASNPYGSILEDLDEDGRLDVAVANLNSDRVSVLLGKGDGTFGGAVNYGTGNGSISVAAGDYDGDGRKDLAVANYYGNTVGVLLGNGEKLLVEDPTGSGVRTGSGRGNVASTSDVDYWSFTGEAGDGLVVAVEVPGSPAASSLSIQTYGPDGSRIDSYASDYYGWGQSGPLSLPVSGTYNVRVSYNNQYFGEYRLRVTLARAPLQLESENNNSIGQADAPSLVLTNGHQVAHVLGYISTGDGNGDYFKLGNLAEGNRVTLHLAQPASSGLSAMMGFYNSSGTLITNAAAGETNLIYALPAGSSGSYYTRVTASAGTAGLFAQYLLDIDLADTLPPMITSDTLPAEGSTNAIVVDRFMLGFSEDMTAGTVTDSGNYELREAGLDGVLDTADDRFYDVVSTGYSSGLTGDYRVGDGPLQAGLYRFKALTGLADRAGNRMAVAYVRSFRVVDVPGYLLENRDNDAPWGATSLSLSGSGQADGSFVSLGSTGVGGHPYWVAAGLFNGDTNLDLAVANNNDGTVSVLLGAGDGSFVLSTNYATGAGPVMVGVVNLNSGGALDLVVANYDSGTISVLLGNGDGTFGVSSNYVVGSRPREIGAGDLNGDGKADLVVANENSDNLSVLVGNGDGTLQGAVNYAAGDGPWSVSLGDVNGDGKQDVAAANQNSDNLSVWLGNGDGTLQGAVNYPAGDGNRSVRLGDLDGNGSLDAVLVSANDNRVNVLLGGGDGTFGGVWSVGTGASNPYGSILEDLDEDGRLDVAVANLNSDRVSVLLGKGDGTFGGAVNYGTGNGSISVAAGDYDGDGRKDLAVANYYGNTVAVLLGNGEKLLVEDPTGSGVRTGSGRGNVASTSDVDYWSFTGEAGDGLVVAVEVPGSPAASSLSIQTIAGPDGSRIWALQE